MPQDICLISQCRHILLYGLLELGHHWCVNSMLPAFRHWSALQYNKKIQGVSYTTSIIQDVLIWTHRRFYFKYMLIKNTHLQARSWTKVWLCKRERPTGEVSERNASLLMDSIPLEYVLTLLSFRYTALIQARILYILSGLGKQMIHTFNHVMNNTSGISCKNLCHDAPLHIPVQTCKILFRLDGLVTVLNWCFSSFIYFWQYCRSQD